MNVAPYMVKAKHNSFEITLPTEKVSAKNYVFVPFNVDWTVHSAGMGESVITSHDQLTVNMRYTADGGFLNFPLAKGMSFVTIVAENAGFALETKKAILNSKRDGDNVIVDLNDGSSWAFFF